MGKEVFSRKAGTGGGLVSPCAACKLLRRRCALDCVFAPYFPANEPQKFANVHRVFGASNVNKLLQVLLPCSLSITRIHKKLSSQAICTDAVSSLVYEANARVRDPVYGCVAAISSLQRHIDVLHAQLAVARAEMIRIRLHHAAYLAQTATASIAITPLTADGSFSAATTPSDIAGDISSEKPLFGYDMLLEHSSVGQPMWSY